MMTYIGMLLLAVGTVLGGMFYFDIAPLLLMKLPLEFTGCVVVALVGAGLMYFNRRPGN